MIFKSINLENFGIIKSFSKEFNKSILVLAGENGMGKSTILKGLLLCVFDDYEGTLADYVNWESNYFQVMVKFSHRGIDYEVLVRYDGITDRTLKFGDKVLKGDEAKRKLKEIMDFDLLKAGMLALEQKVAIMETKPAERREYLKRIYDIEFKQQIADIENDIKVSEIELAKKTTLQAEVENRKYNIPEKLEYPFSKTDYDLVKANLEIERNKLHAAEEKFRIRTETEQKLISLDIQKEKFDENINELKMRIDCNQEKLMGLPEAKNQEVISENKIKTALTVEIVSIENNYETKKANINAELSSIVLERLPTFNLDDFNSVSQELYSKKTKLSELQSATDVCPTCGQNITSPEHIEKRKEEISTLNQVITNLTEQFTMLSNQKNTRETVEKNNLEKENRRTSLQHDLSLLTERWRTDRIQVQAKINQAEEKLKQLDKEYKLEEDGLKEIISATVDNKNNLISQLNSLTVEMTALREKLVQIEIIPLDEFKNNIRKFELDIRSYDDIESRNIEIDRVIKQATEQMEADKKQLNTLKTEIQVLNELIGNWKLGIKVFKTEFPVYVISRVIKDIEKAMNEFLKRTYPKYSVEVQDVKNAMRIVYGPKKRDVSCASGFERQVFSLSFMYAISRAIGNRTLLLDECDSAATEKNSSIFYRVLGDAIGQGIEQIILISHKPSTRNILEFDYGAEVIVFENGIAS